jgi:fermentation-respiration switch protein FrsA (DUF1100 family)
MSRTATLALLLLTAVSLQAAPIDGHWSGGAGDDWRLAMSIAVEGERAKAIVDFPDVGGYARELTGTWRAPRLHVVRPQPGGTAIELDLALEGDVLRGTFKGLGRTAPLLLRRVPPPTDAVVREEPIRFRNGEIELSGTLILPEGDGRVPLVVYTHGAFAESRGPNSSLAIFLARRGIAGLVYDKRGVGESKGEWETASLEDLAADAIAGIHAASQHARIDPQRIGIYGYSQGGWVGPIAASLEPAIRFVIAGGLSAVNAKEQTIHHRTSLMRQGGFDAAAIDRTVLLWRRLYAIPHASPEREEARTAVAAARTEKWFEASGLPPETMEDVPLPVQQLMDFEPLPVWRQVRVPVLAFWGTRDIVVPVTLSRDLLCSALETNHDVTFRKYEGMEHNLLLAGTEWPRIPRTLFGDVAAWIEART